MALALALSASAATAETRPIVVELFTSQGCSSCPPADALLTELSKQPGILALGFHIDYWDRLGWKDPLSAQGSTDRQRAYAKQFGNSGIYTPQMVVDGVQEMVGSRRDTVLTAIRQSTPTSSAPVSFAADLRSVTIGAGAGRGRVTAVRFLRHRTNAVAAGENAGHTAEDINGVETLTALGDWTGAELRLDIAPPAAGEGVAILVQAADGRILGAASTQAAGG